MSFFHISILALIVGLSLFYIFLYLLEKKITQLEQKIRQLFKERNALIPSIFQVSQKYLVKHDDIFNEALRLRKKSFTENSFNKDFPYALMTQEKIHKELNFIFRVCNKHEQLLKEGKFIYLRELVIDKSFHIGEDLELYYEIVKKYNKLITIKNMTIIGLIIPIDYKIGK